MAWALLLIGGLPGASAATNGRAELPKDGEAAMMTLLEKAIKATTTRPALDKPPSVSQALNDLGDMLGVPKFQLSRPETEALDRLIAVMPALAGDDGHFDYGDISPVIETLQAELVQAVREEIARRQEQRLKESSHGPWIRGVLASVDQRLNGQRRFEEGMVEARKKARSGLGEFLTKAGTVTKSPDRPYLRSINLQQLRQFGEDARCLEQVNLRARHVGSPRFVFPRGMTVQDLRAVRQGIVPPGGVPGTP